MTKTKLITIPIEQEKRERLNKYCADKGSTVSQTLTKYIDLLLDGHIDDDDQIANRPGPIDLDRIVELVLDRIKPVVKDEIDRTQSEMSNQLKEQSADIFDLTNNIIRCQRAIEQVNRIKSNHTPDSLPDIDLESSIKVERPPKQPAEATTPNDTYLPVKKTLDDTKEYISEQLKHNKHCKKRSDRITNQEIADSLKNHGFPHPKGKIWHRNYIPQVAKLLGI
jgi:hypothetical protein